MSAPDLAEAFRLAENVVADPEMCAAECPPCQLARALLDVRAVVMSAQAVVAADTAHWRHGAPGRDVDKAIEALGKSLRKAGVR